MSVVKKMPSYGDAEEVVEGRLMASRQKNSL